MAPFLVAFAALPGSAGAVDRIPPDAVAPALAPFAWSATEAGDELSLAYGAGRSGAPELTFQCRRGSGQIRFGYPSTGRVRPIRRGDYRIVLGSGITSERYRAVMEDRDGAPALSARMPGTDAVLSDFRRTGRVTVEGRDENARDPASLGEVRRFFDACG